MNYPEDNCPYGGFVGGDFSEFPGISVFGAFARIVRLNHFRAESYFSAFGLRVRRAEDLSRWLTFNVASRETVAHALRLPRAVPSDISIWLPFKCDPSVIAQRWEFRYCPCCLRYGFHTLLSQLPWMDRCPWHGVLLRTRCVKCDRAMTLNTASGRRLLECICGHDPFNEIESCCSHFDAQIPAEFFQREYLGWAAGQQKHWQLWPPESEATDVSVIGAIISLPEALTYRSQPPRKARPNAHTRTLRTASYPYSEVQDPGSAFAKLMKLERSSAPIELPPQMVSGCISVGCGLAEKMPPASLSDAEMSLFFDGLERQPDKSFKPARRKSISDISFLPPLLVGQRRYLSLGTLSKVAVACLLSLLNAGSNDLAADGEQKDESLKLVLRVAGAVLMRAYAEGIRVVLSQHVPALFDTKRDRPHLTEPWILTRTEENAFVEAKLIWAKNPSLP